MDLSSLIQEAESLLTAREAESERLEELNLRAENAQAALDAILVDLRAAVETREDVDDTLTALRDSIVDHPDSRAAEVVVVMRLDEVLKGREEEAETQEEEPVDDEY